MNKKSFIQTIVKTYIIKIKILFIKNEKKNNYKNNIKYNKTNFFYHLQKKIPKNKKLQI